MVHVSKSTKRLLPPHRYRIETRGAVRLKVGQVIIHFFTNSKVNCILRVKATWRRSGCLRLAIRDVEANAKS